MKKKKKRHLNEEESKFHYDIHLQVKELQIKKNTLWKKFNAAIKKNEKVCFIIFYNFKVISVTCTGQC